jgi:hypothetical protein
VRPGLVVDLFAGGGGASIGIEAAMGRRVDIAINHSVLLASAPGGLVVDPFCGSGTTGQAAIAHGRRFLGIDESADYVAMARRRLGGPLFAGTEASA